MKYLLVFLLSASAYAGIRFENNAVQPFDLKDYSLKALVKDYAELMNYSVSFPSDMIGEKERINLRINTKMTKEEFQTIVFSLLGNRGYNPHEQNGIFWIHSVRQVRYMASPITTDQNFPSDARFRMAVYRLKFPISSILARNLRPVMSRYGRIIDLSDARTLVINDTAENLKRIFKTIEFMDDETTYKNFVHDIPKKDPDAIDPANAKIVELEAEKRILEKKYMELKESTMTGVMK